MLAAEDVVNRIAAQCASVDDQGRRRDSADLLAIKIAPRDSATAATKRISHITGQGRKARFRANG